MGFQIGVLERGEKKVDEVRQWTEKPRKDNEGVSESEEGTDERMRSKDSCQ